MEFGYIFVGFGGFVVVVVVIFVGCFCVGD